MNEDFIPSAASDLIGEPMITAKQASAALGLPYYWFADRTMRGRYRIAHYLLVGLVRFRGSELAAWARNGHGPQKPCCPTTAEGRA